MTRPKPREADLQTYGPAFDALCESARLFWAHQSVPAISADIVVVDLLMQDIRLALRNLTQAAALARVLQSRIVAIVGPDPDWTREIWQYYDADRLAQLARAYGAEEVLDLSALAERSANGSLRELVVAGQHLPLAEHPGTAREHYRQIVDATAIRILRVPQVTDPVREEPRYRAIVARSRQFARIYDALMGGGVAAFVTSHADYSQWGLGVDAAIRHKVPVIHVQATGDLKSYALFPEHVVGDGTFRSHLTRLIGHHFETELWPRRDLLHDASERTAWRAKGNLGRPSWWRGGGAISKLEIRTPAERADIRRYAASRLGLDPVKPVVGVFNHAASDAVWCNAEIFADLAEWLTETVRYAAGHPEVTWLFLDHPKQANYDGTEHFERLAEQYRGSPHLVFRPSMSLSKNSMWSLVDLAVTVRGSVSNEFPAYGIPALQAGWSEWSHCGFSERADSVPHYWDLLGSILDRLGRGEQIISSDQVRRARLWLWAYRCGTDVVSPLVPYWETGQGDALYASVALAMNHIEADGDPVLVSTARMWSRREPLLTRVCLSLPEAEVARALGLPSRSTGTDSGEPAFGMATTHDRIGVPTIPNRITSGASPWLCATEGFVRGTAVVGRARQEEAMLALRVGELPGPVRVSIRLLADDASTVWWRQQYAADLGEAAPVTRVLSATLAGRWTTRLTLVATPDDPGVSTGTAWFDLQPGDVDHRGVLVIELAGVSARRGAGAAELPGALVGVRVDAVEIAPRGPSLPPGPVRA